MPSSGFEPPRSGSGMPPVLGAVHREPVDLTSIATVSARPAWICDAGLEVDAAVSDIPRLALDADHAYPAPVVVQCEIVASLTRRDKHILAEFDQRRKDHRLTGFALACRVRYHFSLPIAGV